jgi:hypothetical protein
MMPNKNGHPGYRDLGPGEVVKNGSGRQWLNYFGRRTAMRMHLQFWQRRFTSNKFFFDTVSDHIPLVAKCRVVADDD